MVMFWEVFLDGGVKFQKMIFLLGGRWVPGKGPQNRLACISLGHLSTGLQLR